MNASHFGAMRAAVRAALAAGYTRESVASAAARGAGSGARFLMFGEARSRIDWRKPYALELLSDSGDWQALALTDGQSRVFDDCAYIWRTDDGYDSGDSEPDTYTCERCDTAGPTDNDWSEVFYRSRGRTESETWCESCAGSHASYCNQTEHLWRDDEMTECDGETVSQHWAENNASYCGSSGNYFYNDSCECSECSPDDDDGDGSASMYQYGTNVLRRHSWPGEVKADALCFGVELETEPGAPSGRTQSELAAALGGRNGHSGELGGAYILAHDGSLDYGVEIITVPQTLEQHHTGRRVPWRKIATALKDSGARAGAGTTNCGMHVHINRKALSALTVGKMLVLINSPHMRSLVECVAQRSATSYCRRTTKKVTDVNRPHDHSDHYDALNIGTEHGTLELRIFRGNTRHSRIMKNLEFTHALCIYCRDASMRDIEDPAKMRAWVAQRAGQYPNLAKFLNEHPNA